nr:hypothetical protein [Candidatus Sigynarchaeum springense]
MSPKHFIQRAIQAVHPRVVVRCAACGREAPKDIEGVTWVVCAGCLAAMPGAARAALVAKRAAVDRAERVLSRVTYITGICGVASIVVPALLGASYVVAAVLFLCVVCAAATVSIALERAKDKYHDQVHETLIASKPVPDTR